MIDFQSSRHNVEQLFLYKKTLGYPIDLPITRVILSVRILAFPIFPALALDIRPLLDKG